LILIYYREIYSNLDRRKTVFVVPAFEMEDFSRGIPETKEEVVEFAKENRIRQVRILTVQSQLTCPYKDKWSPAHGATNYDLWYTTEKLYDIAYNEGYEPYIVARTDIPL
jgi:hypothetical protein